MEDQRLASATSFMARRSGEWMGNLCINPVCTKPQYRREGRTAGVNQWPPWDNHSLHIGKERNQCTMFFSWWLQKLMFGWCLKYLEAVSGRIFCSDDARGIFLLPRITLFVPVRSEHQESIEHALSRWKNKHLHSCAICLSIFATKASLSQWMCLKKAPEGTWIPWRRGFVIVERLVVAALLYDKFCESCDIQGIWVDCKNQASMCQRNRWFLVML